MVKWNRMTAPYQKLVYQKSLEMNDNIRYEILYNIIKKIKKSNLNLLDVGCATGNLLEKFVKHHNCYGVDIEENFVSMAKSKGIIAYHTAFFLTSLKSHPKRKEKQWRRGNGYQKNSTGITSGL